MHGCQIDAQIFCSKIYYSLILGRSPLLGAVAFLALPALIGTVSIFVDIETDSLMGLALFHTFFNILGVIIFFPFLGLFSRLLVKVYPDHKTILTVFLHQTPPEVTDAATAALRKEIGHLLQECQLYNLRLLRIDEKLVFDGDLPFELNRKRTSTLEELYENIKLLHAEIFTYYAKILANNLDEAESKELERLIYASRNMMNSIKNFKGVRHNLDEFDGSDNAYLNLQYKQFRKRLIGIYHEIGLVLQMAGKKDQYENLMSTYLQIEEADQRFIDNTLNAVTEGKIQELEIASLLLVNRLFTQSCRMQVYGMKDLLLSQDLVNHFDRTMDAKVNSAAEQNSALPA